MRAVWDFRASFYDMVFKLPFFKGVREKEKAAFLALMRRLEIKEPRVLDVACGTGQYLSLIKDGSIFCGLDLSENMLRASKNNGASCILGDATVLPFKDGSFDLVLCMGLVEYFRDKQGILAEVGRVMRREGYAIVSYSRKGLLNTMRNLLGSRVYPSTRTEMAISLNNCNLICAEERTTYLQGLLVCKRS